MGVNYFAYAVLKGCIGVARLMLEQLRAGKKKEDMTSILNSKIKK